MRRLIAILAAVLALGSGQAVAQSVHVTGATITWYGNYTPGKIQTVKDAGTPSGTKDIITGLQPSAANSDHVAAVQPSYFGFGYRLSGGPDKAVFTVRHVRKVPPPGFADSKTGQAVFTVETTVNVTTDRRDLFIGQAITDAATIPTGLWTFQVWYGDKLLAEKSITVEKQ